MHFAPLNDIFIKRNRREYLSIRDFFKNSDITKDQLQSFLNLWLVTRGKLDADLVNVLKEELSILKAMINRENPQKIEEMRQARFKFVENKILNQKRPLEEGEEFNLRDQMFGDMSSKMESMFNSMVREDLLKRLNTKDYKLGITPQQIKEAFPDIQTPKAKDLEEMYQKSKPTIEKNFLEAFREQLIKSIEKAHDPISVANILKEKVDEIETQLKDEKLQEAASTPKTTSTTKGEGGQQQGQRLSHFLKDLIK